MENAAAMPGADFGRSLVCRRRAAQSGALPVLRRAKDGRVRRRRGLASRNPARGEVLPLAINRVGNFK